MKFIPTAFALLALLIEIFIFFEVKPFNAGHVLIPLWAAFGSNALIGILKAKTVKTRKRGKSNQLGDGHN